MQRAPAAEWHCDEARWIMPALDRDEPDRARHARVRHPHDRGRGGGGVETERLADMRRNGLRRGLDVE